MDRFLTTNFLNNELKKMMQESIKKLPYAAPESLDKSTKWLANQALVKQSQCTGLGTLASVNEKNEKRASTLDRIFQKIKKITHQGERASGKMLLTHHRWRQRFRRGHEIVVETP